MMSSVDLQVHMDMLFIADLSDFSAEELKNYFDDFTPEELKEHLGNVKMGDIVKAQLAKINIDL